MEDLLFELLVNTLGDKLKYILIPIVLFILFQIVLIIYRNGIDTKSLIVGSLIFSMMPIAIIVHGVLSISKNPSMNYNFGIVSYLLAPLVFFWILYFGISVIRKRKEERD